MWKNTRPSRARPPSPRKQRPKPRRTNRRQRKIKNQFTSGTAHAVPFFCPIAKGHLKMCAYLVAPWKSGGGATALQNAGALTDDERTERSVLECASPLALWDGRTGQHGAEKIPKGFHHSARR